MGGSCNGRDDNGEGWRVTPLHATMNAALLSITSSPADAPPISLARSSELTTNCTTLFLPLPRYRFRIACVFSMSNGASRDSQ